MRLRAGPDDRNTKSTEMPVCSVKALKSAEAFSSSTLVYTVRLWANVPPANARASAAATSFFILLLLMFGSAGRKMSFQSVRGASESDDNSSPVNGLNPHAAGDGLRICGQKAAASCWPAAAAPLPLLPPLWWMTRRSAAQVAPLVDQNPRHRV